MAQGRVRIPNSLDPGYPFFFSKFIALTLYHKMSTFDVPEKMPFENCVRKGENAGDQVLLLFPIRFQKASYLNSLTLSQTTYFRSF